MTLSTVQNTCSQCDRPSHIYQGRWLCQMHYRIASMRAAAARRGKVSPSREEMEALVPNPFVCEGCHREMVWLQRDGASQQATFQHDRDGTLRIICLRCNSRHSTMPGDMFWEIPEGHKYCPSCAQVLPLTQFYSSPAFTTGALPSCIPCYAVKNRIAKAKRRQAKRAQHA